jgi:hypothetical protein
MGRGRNFWVGRTMGRYGLNIAEASGKTGGADRARFHAIARGSAFESPHLPRQPFPPTSS